MEQTNKTEMVETFYVQHYILYMQERKMAEAAGGCNLHILTYLRQTQ